MDEPGWIPAYLAPGGGAMTRIQVAVICGVIAVLGLCLLPSVPIDIAINLTLGWVAFLARVVPGVRIGWGGVATGVVCLVLFATGSHYLLGWLYEQMRGTDGVDVPVDGRWKPRWTASLITVVVTMFFAGLATTGVAHQVGWLLTSKERLVGSNMSRLVLRLQSVNNLKQIGLGLSFYHDAMRTFPPGGTFDEQGRPLHGWQTMLLPYTEQGALFNEIDLDIPWDAPRNVKPFQTVLGAYLNPGIQPGVARDREGYALSHYAGSARVLGGNVPRAREDIKDGGSQSIMAGEIVDGFKPWGDPANWRDPAKGINRSPDGFGSPYSGGADFLFVDGSVRFLKDGIDPRVLKALSTPDGGEGVSSEQY
jgi:prepilin-type processing-associated H-X9-DG protein